MTLADVLTAAGVLNASIVVAECDRSGVPPELVCTVLQKESGVRQPDGTVTYGNNVYGHDTVACMSVPGVLVEVTAENYATYLACVYARDPSGRVGRNGVGPMQLTHYTLQDRADELGKLEGKGCWHPETNVRVGVEHLAALLRSPASAREAEETGQPIEWVVFRRYNGKPAYADHAMTLLPHWQRIVQEATVSVLVVQMGHVGRPRFAGDRASVGTAGEQDFTKRAAASCQRLLSRNGWTVRVINADPGYPNPTTLGGNPEYYRGDAFVAIHCDGSENTARDGASFGYRDGGRGFAQDIKGAYLLRTGREAAWLEPDNYTTNLSQYYGTGLATSVGNTRAVIMECGFLTNPVDRDMLLAPTGPDNVAYAIGDALGITHYTQEDDVDPNVNAFLYGGGPDTNIKPDAAGNPIYPAGVDRNSVFGRLVDVQFALSKTLPILVSAAQQGVQVDPESIRAVVDTAVRSSVAEALDEVDVDLGEDDRGAIASAVQARLAAALMQPAQAVT